MKPTGVELAQRLIEGDLTAAPAVLNLVESHTADRRAEIHSLLRSTSIEALGGEAPGHIIGLTGPPGVGKSTLLSELLPAWRSSGRTVAVLTVDPTSRRSGGSLLGDRARISVNPGDCGSFVRSTASGTRLGGLAPSTRAAAHALAVAFDVVVVETVGVGQGETDISELADTVVVALQPGAGDVLQFIKSGIMEIPDILVVTKADLGPIAEQTQQDLESALGTLGRVDTLVLSVSCLTPATGVDKLVTAIQAVHAKLDLQSRRLAARQANALADFTAEHGQRGLRTLGGQATALTLLKELPPTLDEPTMIAALEEKAEISR